MRENIAFLAIILALVLGFAVHKTYYRRSLVKTRKQLKRELEEAEQHHSRRSHIRKLYVKATTELLKQESA